MNDTEFNPHLWTKSDLESSVSKIEKYLPFKQRQMFRHLINRYQETRRLDGLMAVLEFYKEAGEFKERPNINEDANARSLFARGRTLIYDMRKNLDEYYSDKLHMPSAESDSDPSFDKVKSGEAELVLYIEIPGERGSGYKPVIKWRTRNKNRRHTSLNAAPTVPFRVATENLSDSIDQNLSLVKCDYIGTNAQAMKYLTNRIRVGVATRIEDTAIRWNIMRSLYLKDDLNDFKEALAESHAEFISITGPVKDSAYMKALMEAFERRTADKPKPKCFQLHHVAPIMNFINLKYLAEPEEVLFGFGMQHGHSTSEETAVFSSSDKRLVEEFKDLFKVLRSESFSTPINLTTGMSQTYLEQCDVLATFQGMPKKFIRASEISQDCKIINIAITYSDEIERLESVLKESGRRDITVRILLSHPESRFLRMRSRITSRKNLPPLAYRNLDILRGFNLGDQLQVRLTNRVMAVTYTQINTTTIFSPYWSGPAAADGTDDDGTYFVVESTSNTGIFLEKQFKNWWKTAQKVNLETPDIPPVRKKLVSAQLSGVFMIRKAKTDDAQAICTLADSRSKKTRLHDGVSEHQLEREGFLFYPLSPDYYRERIERSDHFWVVENGGQIVAFAMAYTFREMYSFTYLTENDRTLLVYFSNGGWEPACVYLAQAATKRSRESRGSIAALTSCFLKYATDAGAPAILCEISLKPRNGASIGSAIRSGFRMVGKRIKTDPTTGKDRVSGTFMQTLGGKILR